MNSLKAVAAAALLEQVANGERSAVSALEEWPQDIGADPLLDASWHDLSHFANDSDIRTKDLKYATYQKSRLLTRAQQVREKYGT